MDQVEVLEKQLENLRTELPGYGKNVLLVNDRPVIGGSMKLENYDIVTIGSTKLMFVGLCGKDFNWGSEGKEHE